MAIDRLVIGLALLALLGCGAPEGKPAPGLKVPDVPPGGRDTKGTLKAPKR